MPEIFMNYRTGDGDGIAAFLELALSARFGSDVVFRAAKSIPIGDDFRHALLTAVRRSDALLAVVGDRWLDRDAEGLRRIDDPDDWTRREIAEALARGIRVVPVLVGPVKLPPEDTLPPDLAGLAVRQYERLEFRSLDTSIDRLSDRLMQIIPGLREQEPEPAGAGDGTHVTNNVRDAQIGVQGTVNGDVRFGRGSFSRGSGRRSWDGGDA
ncbi:toll/interleukin-1 receptor domain-containing protein [Spirillospora sp. NPDC047279]|uniref:toll/interleukin-1 receptor domain-containing protein n=1 Tax=Spirillospora sp. NPDC047279 TaxID=3155478 RepID=UPI0033EB73C1